VLGLCVSAELLGKHDQARMLANALASGPGLALARQMRRPEHRQMLEAILQAAGV
jgi:hypothetical protein